MRASEPLEEIAHQALLLARHRQRVLAQPQHATATETLGATVEQLAPRPFGEGIEELADHAVGHLPLDPPGLAAPQCVGVGIEVLAAQQHGFAAAELVVPGRHHHAGREPRHLVGARRQHRFVEIVDVEVDDAVVPLGGAEILEMEIAGNPGARRCG